VEIRVDRRLSLYSESIFLSVYESLKNIPLIFHQEEMDEFAKVHKTGIRQKVIFLLHTTTIFNSWMWIRVMDLTLI
jgi:hypothetical protein